MRVFLARRDPALFGKTMVLVAGAAGCFALGAYAGRSLATGIAIVAYLAALWCLLCLRFAARRRAGASTVLLVAFGILTGAALAPTIVYYTAVDPRVLWDAGGAAGLFTAACGAGAYLTRPDLPRLARVLLSEVLAVLACGIVLVCEHMPSGAVTNSAIAVAAYAVAVILGFLLLRRDGESARLLAAAIFAWPVNAFFFLVRNTYGRIFRWQAELWRWPVGPG
jgi:FtsH-binding integral membrane protein